jgi:hypothetical protein
MVERQLPKLHTRVRFPSPAPILNQVSLQSLAGSFATVVRFLQRLAGNHMNIQKRTILVGLGATAALFAVPNLAISDEVRMRGISTQ